MVLGGSWWFLVGLGGFWVILGGSVAPGDRFRPPWTPTPPNTYDILSETADILSKTVLGGSWWFLVVLGGSGWVWVGSGWFLVGLCPLATGFGLPRPPTPSKTSDILSKTSDILCKT